jgi:nicotinic acid phosphoribosyltransferase
MRQIFFAIALTITLAGLSLAAPQKKGCEELKGEIAARLDTKGVKNYSLEIVASDSVKDEKVVGTCEAGSKSIVYKRN